MAEDLTITKGDKKTQYESLLPQIQGLLSGETNLVANLGNIAAALKEQENISTADICAELFEGNNIVVGNTDHGQSELLSGPFANKKANNDNSLEEVD